MSAIEVSRDDKAQPSEPKSNATELDVEKLEVQLSNANVLSSKTSVTRLFHQETDHDLAILKNVKLWVTYFCVNMVITDLVFTYEGFYSWPLFN